MLSQKPLQLGSPNVTQKCWTISPKTQFILLSKGQKSNSQVTKAMQACFLHYCECRILIVGLLWHFCAMLANYLDSMGGGLGYWCHVMCNSQPMQLRVVEILIAEREHQVNLVWIRWVTSEEIAPVSLSAPTRSRPASAEHVRVVYGDVRLSGICCQRRMLSTTTVELECRPHIQTWWYLIDHGR